MLICQPFSSVQETVQLESLYVPVLPAAVVVKEDSFGQSCAKSACHGFVSDKAFLYFKTVYPSNKKT